MEDVAKDNDIPFWKDNKEGQPKCGEQLDKMQTQQITSLLRGFENVFDKQPNYTTSAEHRSETGDNPVIHLPLYRLPNAFCNEVKKELKEMLKQ